MTTNSMKSSIVKPPGDKNRNTNRKSNEQRSDNSSRKRNDSGSTWRQIPVVILVLCCAFLHRYHVSSMFENQHHFSHLSTLEREMTFRTEMGLYYSYYKRLIEAPTIQSGFYQITHDNSTEFPLEINCLQRFNVYPEVLIAFLYRGYQIGIEMWNWPSKQCWQVERGSDLPPITSCEGLGEPMFFYLEAVWLCAAITMALIFLLGHFISDSVFGGILSVVCFFYNHGECTRVQWTPPLRESFAYPFCLLQMLSVCRSLRICRLPKKCRQKLSNFSEVLFIYEPTWIMLITWQFSQFVLFTQTVAVFLMYVTGVTDKVTLIVVLSGQLAGLIHADICLFGNKFLLCSIFTCTVCSILFTVLVLEPVLLSRFNIVPQIATLVLFSTSGALILKFHLANSLGIVDDMHIINILRAKLSSYQDFHTMLYTCAAEFDFMPLEVLKNLSQTFLLPSAALALGFVLINWINRWETKCKIEMARSVKYLQSIIEPEIVYIILQLGAFTLMAVFIMRLKLFFTPMLCIFVSVLASRKFIPFIQSAGIHWALIMVLISGMSVKGFQNLEYQRNIIGEYSNIPLEDLLTWVNSSTSVNSVFAGPMSVMANILLSTRRNIVNHPHYEDANLRERTKKVYSVFSRKSAPEAHKILSDMMIDYVVLEERWCLSSSKKGCNIVDLWDVEDRNNSNKPQLCPLLFFKNPAPFYRVFANDVYVVLKINSQAHAENQSASNSTYSDTHFIELKLPKLYKS